MRHCLKKVKCWYCLNWGHKRAECSIRKSNERFLNPAPDTGRGPRDAWGRERKYEGPTSYERNRYGREDRWEEGKKVLKKQGKVRTLYTGEQGEKEVLPKGETSGPEATLSVS